GRVKTICRVSINALKNGRPARLSHGKPLRGAGVSAAGPTAGVFVDLASDGGGGGGAPVANSGNFESCSQVDIPSRQPRSVEMKRPVRSPSRTSSSENVPRPVVPRVM